jgi:hypothetical protein
MRKPIVVAFIALFASPLVAQTTDEIIARFLKTVGGMDKIDSVKSLRRVGKFQSGGGTEYRVAEEYKRPNLARQEYTIQGMTAVYAYDGRNGWKIEPWQGKKDPEAMGEEELKSIIEDADFDGPLVNYRQKGNKIEYVGVDSVEGTDTFKLKVTSPNGDVRYYYLDTDYYVPIKIDTKRIVRGAEREYESIIGDYKEVNGWYLPYSFETKSKGSATSQKIAWESMTANVPLDDSRFGMPSAAGKPPQERQGQPADASQVQPKKPEEKKQAPEEKKPPVGRAR